MLRDATGTERAVPAGAVSHAVARATPDRSRRSAFLLGLAFAALVALGCWPRADQWVTFRSLWMDEQFIALGIRRPLGSLAGPLPYDQAVPLGWLWVEHGLMRLVGPGEGVLRLVPFVAGCAGVAFAALVGRRLFRPPAGMLLVLLVAVQPVLIHQSAQLKPYTLDAAATLILVWLGLRASEPRSSDRTAPGPAAAFWVTAAVVVWLSTPAILAAAAIGGVLVLVELSRLRWRAPGPHGLWAIPFAASVGVTYAVHLRFQQDNGRLAAYWTEVFPTSLGPRELGLGSGLAWVGDAAVGLIHLPLGVARSAPVLSVPGSVWVLALTVLLGLGLACLIARGAGGAVVYAPVLAAFALGATGLYPLADRAALWVAPLLLALLCAPFDAAVRGLESPGRSRLPRRVAFVVAAAVAAGPLVAFAPQALRTPYEARTDRYALTRQAFAHVATHGRRGDVVLVQPDSVPAALWYADQLGLEWTGSLVEARGAACAIPMRARQPGAARLWVVLGLGATAFPAYVTRIRAEAAAEGTDLGIRRFRGVWVLEVDLTVPPTVRERLPACLVAGPKAYRNRL